jgi:hypothetical protein
MAALGSAAATMFIALWFAACADQTMPTSPSPRSPSARPAFNVMGTTAGEVWLCPEGPAGTYSYSVSVTIPANWTNGTTSGTYSAADLALAADAAHQTPVVSPETFTIPASNSSASCQLVFKVLKSIDFVNPVDGTTQDAVRLVTLTQLSAPAGTQLDSIVSTTGGAPDVVSLPPTITVVVDPNFFHGSVVSFWNSTPVTPPECPPVSITSNFNGTPIAGGNFIWFNAVFKPSGVGSGGGTLNFDNGKITFSAGGNSFSVPVPPSTVTFSPVAAQASTTFDGVRWQTVVPASYTGNIFLGGVPFQVPAGGLPGGTPSVVWSEQMTSNVSTLKLNWQWAAAVYTSFSTNNTLLGVKPVDSNSLSVYQNSDHAGTPENFKSFVTGGARGGGGSNFTGSYSGTGTGKICVE